MGSRTFDLTWRLNPRITLLFNGPSLEKGFLTAVLELLLSLSSLYILVEEDTKKVLYKIWRNNWWLRRGHNSGMITSLQHSTLSSQLPTLNELVWFKDEYKFGEGTDLRTFVPIWQFCKCFGRKYLSFWLAHMKTSEEGTSISILIHAMTVERFFEPWSSGSGSVSLMLPALPSAPRAVLRRLPLERGWTIRKVHALLGSL